MLDGNDSELKGHVGHRVEISGTLDNSHAKSGSTTGSTTGTPATAGADTSSRMDSGSQHLKVASVRMISPDCSSR